MVRCESGMRSAKMGSRAELACKTGGSGRGGGPGSSSEREEGLFATYEGDDATGGEWETGVFTAAKERGPKEG